MSAFVQSKTHIAALVRFALDNETRGSHLRWFSEDPRPMAEMATSHEDYFRRIDAIRRELTSDKASISRACWLLVIANVASVTHKYPDDPSNLPGPIEPYWISNGTDFPPLDWPALIARAPRLSPVQALHAIAGYTYQSCEHPGWFGSEAWRFIDALRDLAIRRLPGYGEANTWEIHDPEEVAR